MSLKEFKALKSKINESLQKLVETDTVKKAESPVDDRIFGVTKDASGNASATIRFLPQKDPSKSPIVRTFRHSLEQKGRWFIEECPVTVGKKCPVCEYSSSIWGDDEDTARKFWRKKTYIANVLIVDDPAKPENNGRVMLFKFGQQIYDMIMKVVNCEDESERLNIFDFDEGYNLKLNCIQLSGYNNYDRKSAFSLKPSAVAGGNETEQEKIYNQIHDLSEFLDPKLYKEYVEIEEKLNRYLGVKVEKKTTLEDDIKEEKKVATKFAAKKKEDEDDDDFDFNDLDDDDDDLAF